MPLGFQTVVRTTKRGAVLTVEYLSAGPSNNTRFLYTKRDDSWRLFDRTGNQGLVRPSFVVAVFKGVEARIKEMYGA